VDQKVALDWLRPAQVEQRVHALAQLHQVPVHHPRVDQKVALG